MIPSGQRVQGRVQPGGQVPRHGQQPVRRGPGLAQRQGQLVPGELVHHRGHLPRLRLEPVLGVTPEHLRDGHQLAGRGVRLEPVPGAHQPDQLMISRPAERSHPARRRPPRRRRPPPAGRSPAITSHAIPVPNPAARLADSPGKTRADPACPGPRRPVLAASRASISSAAASRDPGQLLRGQLVLARRRRAGLRIPVLLRGVERVVVLLRTAGPATPPAPPRSSGRGPARRDPRPTRGPREPVPKAWTTSVRQKYCSSNMIPYIVSNYQLFDHISNRNTNVTGEIQRTARGQRAQIVIPNPGALRPHHPPADRQRRQVICPGARLIEEGPDVAGLSSHGLAAMPPVQLRLPGRAIVPGSRGLRVADRH